MDVLCEEEEATKVGFSRTPKVSFFDKIFKKNEINQT